MGSELLIRFFIRCFLCGFLTFFTFSTAATPPSSPFFRFNLPIEALEIAQYFLPQNPIIIDAGAFDGTESAVMAKKWPQGHVHSFEPVPEIYQKLIYTASFNSNMSTYDFALSEKDGMAEMFVSEINSQPGIPSQSSSLLAPKEHIDYAPHVIFPRAVTVQTYKVDTLTQVYNIPRVDMMWLDMQGIELDVLKASPKILETTKVVLTEVEFVEAYAGQYLYEDIKKWFESQGFVLIGCNFNPEFPTENGIWFGDALFVRKELLP